MLISCLLLFLLLSVIFLVFCCTNCCVISVQFVIVLVGFKTLHLTNLVVQKVINKRQNVTFCVVCDNFQLVNFQFFTFFTAVCDVEMQRSKLSILLNGLISPPIKLSMFYIRFQLDPTVNVPRGIFLLNMSRLHIWRTHRS